MLNSYFYSICACLLVVIAIFLNQRLLPMVTATGQQTAADVASFLLHYATALLALLFAGVSWQLAKKQELVAKIRINRLDLLCVFALFGASLAIRFQGPVTGAVDEAIHFSETIGVYAGKYVPITKISETSYPYFIHWCVAFLFKTIGGTVEAFTLHKTLSIISASLSIAVWYLIGRLYLSRAVAFSGALILCTWGWHYVNSRFLYLYPHDLLVIALGVLCSILAFRDDRAVAAIGLGFIWCYALVARKISIVLIPFSFYIFLEYVFARGQVSRLRKLTLLAACCISFLFAFAPWIAANPIDLDVGAWGSKGGFFRYQQAIDSHHSINDSSQGGRLWRWAYIYFDAFRQLWLRSYDQTRHVLVINGPLLDPFLSVLFAIGLLVAIFKGRSQRFYRILLVGLFIFIAPMALSYPLDSSRPQGIARRMLGITGFVAVLGAIGADRLAAMFTRPAWRAGVCIALCSLSVLANGYLYKYRYLKQPGEFWSGDHGVHRAAMLTTARTLAQTEGFVVILEDFSAANDPMFADLSNIRIARSVAAIREFVQTLPAGSTIAILIPAPLKARGFDTKAIMSALSDLIPQETWQAGPPHVDGKPLLYFVRTQSPNS